MFREPREDERAELGYKDGQVVTLLSKVGEKLGLNTTTLRCVGQHDNYSVERVMDGIYFVAHHIFPTEKYSDGDMLIEFRIDAPSEKDFREVRYNLLKPF